MANELIIIDQQQLQYGNEILQLTVLGGIRLEGLDRMRVTIKVEVKESPRSPFRHTVDLYNDTQLEKFIRKCAEKLETGTLVIAASLAELTEKLEHYRLEQIKQQGDNNKPQIKPLTAAEREAATKYLQQSNLLEQTKADIGKSGVVGEANNRLLMYIVYTYRKATTPLHIICLASSGTGKTHLQEKVGELIPEEDKIEITTLSENAVNVTAKLSKVASKEINQKYGSNVFGFDRMKANWRKNDVLEKVWQFHALGRSISMINAVRYLEGKGGYDIYSYERLKGNITFDRRNTQLNTSIVKEIGTNIQKLQSENRVGTVNFVIDKQFSISQGAALASDLGTAFGSYQILTRTTVSVSFQADGSYNFSANTYSTFRDTYRWHPGRGEQDDANHDAWEEMKNYGAKEFSIRAYYEQTITGGSNTVTSSTNLKDSEDVRHHRDESGHYYSKPEDSKLVNDYRKKK